MSRLTHAEKARKRRVVARDKPFDPDAPWHGTTNGYTNHCCRCEDCRAVFREYSNVRRKRPEVAERIRAGARENAKLPHVRHAKRARNYGLTPEELTALLDAGVCSACGTTEPGFHGWSVDHDHSCCDTDSSCGECVRGILCRTCNVALGQVGDNIDHLEALLQYLVKWNNRAS